MNYVQSYFVNLCCNFYGNEKYLDFLNTLLTTSNFPTRCWKKASLSHGWRIDAGYVIYQQPISKHLENQIFAVCKNHSINFTQYDYSNVKLRAKTLITYDKRGCHKQPHKIILF